MLPFYVGQKILLSAKLQSQEYILQVVQFFQDVNSLTRGNAKLHLQLLSNSSCLLLYFLNDKESKKL